MLLLLVIPVYNEAATLPRLIERLDAVPPAHGLERRIVIVDDGSTDGTTEIVRGLTERADVRAVFRERNGGKGAALRDGFRMALEEGADIILIQDGDLEYDPADHESVLRPILDGRADAVIGSRFIGQTHRVIYYWHWVANQIVTQLSNMLTNLNLSDIECGTKAFRRAVVERLRIEEDRFGVEPELIAKLSLMRMSDDDVRGPGEPGTSSAWSAGGGGLRRLRIYEVPVSYAGRTYEEGKKIGWRDGLSALRAIVKYTLLQPTPYPGMRPGPRPAGGAGTGPDPRARESTT